MPPKDLYYREMKRAFYTVFIVGILNSSAAYCGNVTGTIHFKGQAPKSERVNMSADSVCAQEQKSHPVDKEDLVVNANGTLADVFVFVKEGVSGEVPPAPAEPLVFDQRGCHYLPHVFGIRVGQTLKMINDDPTFHNVHAVAKANPSFNVGMPTKGMVLEKKFFKPEQMVRLKCDMHGWMNAYAGVMDHPYFAVSDSTGGYTIANLPPGEYTIEAWQEKLGTKMEKVKVAGNGAKVDFIFGAAAGK